MDQAASSLKYDCPHDDLAPLLVVVYQCNITEDHPSANLGRDVALRPVPGSRVVEFPHPGDCDDASVDRMDTGLLLHPLKASLADPVNS